MSCPIEFGDHSVNTIAQLKQLPASALLVGDDPINARPQLRLAHPADRRCVLGHAAKVAGIALNLEAKSVFAAAGSGSLASLRLLVGDTPPPRLIFSITSRPARGR